MRAGLKKDEGNVKLKIENVKCKAKRQKPNLVAFQLIPLQ